MTKKEKARLVDYRRGINYRSCFVSSLCTGPSGSSASPTAHRPHPSRNMYFQTREMKDARVSLEARDVFFTSDDDPLSIVSRKWLSLRFSLNDFFFFLLLLNLQQTNSEISILYNVYHL